MTLLLLFTCSVVSHSETPWTVAHHAPLSMGFFRKEYTAVGCHFLHQGIFLSQAPKPRLPQVHCIAGRFFTTSHQGSPSDLWQSHSNQCRHPALGPCHSSSGKEEWPKFTDPNPDHLGRKKKKKAACFYYVTLLANEKGIFDFGENKLNGRGRRFKSTWQFKHNPPLPLLFL